MKALRNTSWKPVWPVAIAVAVAGVLILQCANPSSQDVRWRTSVDLPVTSNKKFLMGAMMDTLFFNHKTVQTTVSYDTIHRTGLPDSVVRTIDTTMQLLNGYPVYDSTLKKTIPDTVAFGFPTKDSTSTKISEDSLEDKQYDAVFGTIPLTSTSPTSLTVPLAGAYVGGTRVNLPAVPVTVRYVFHVDLADTPQTLQLNLTNNTPATAFSVVRVTMGALGTDSVSNLAAGTKGTLSYDARHKSIDSVLNVTVSFTTQASGTFSAGSNLAVDFSLNGLFADRVVVLDSMLASFQRIFTNPYKLTDTVDVDYIDIDKGFFIYSVTNHTNLDLLLSVTHRHLWRSDFCAGRTPALMQLENLVGLSASDSLLAYNGNIANREAFLAGQTNEYRKQNISANRLFAEWDSGMQKSVTKVDYRVNIGVYGRRVALSSADSLMFVIRTTSFKFKELYGKSMEEYSRISTPSTVPVKLPWTKSVTDSLRDHFKLQKVLADVKTRVNIPDSAFIDTMKLHYVIASVTHPSVACSSDVVLQHVTRDSLFTRPIDITGVVNDYPDSVRVNISLLIPRYTHIRAENDLTDPRDTDYTKYIGRMIVKGLVNYNMVAPLSWTVLDTASMDLGGDTLDLGKVGMITDPLKKMTDRHADFTVEVVNYTNIYLRLYALVATDSTKVGPLVDSSNKARYINSNQLTDLINSPTPGFVNLLGNGLLIPPRDSTTKIKNTIALNESDLGQILRAKVTGWRWQVRFLPRFNNGIVDSSYDALKNTDWLKLNSWIHIDGVNSIDSLFQ